MAQDTAPSVLDCLRRAARRDAEKGGIAARSTREVADYCGMSVAKARRHLWEAVERGEVEAIDGGASVLWRAVAQGSAAPGSSKSNPSGTEGEI